MVSPFEVIGKNLLKKETSIQLFINLKVVLSTGEVGVIEGSFGQSGKVKIRVMGKNLELEKVCGLSGRVVLYNNQGEVIPRDELGLVV